ncbi:MAG: zinc ABC transporter ATP-binding protein ZnuC [Alphaproteobacteria bacterium]|nr:zinc ABC transporter ATP-binding protein ZnuC [Alphaproteobacteria bacterium]MBU0797870.1 zinc ABC transporter ATP-binding protein ZnuC [Alphaproteobacteria bacterium]MBU0886178.1 zinc ABC transporter ATP-binding protein ZnuC [Alphaproteobacteria bacterium]MBU1812818.1 zinc ABC transporter ATP-binding protein ZnuC [Alphaproteobacteria bacterium]MBU2092226.1 zinc ABC transporter ATP-binding protein ZnuC [Alphaproteobacteria bacterium]
MPDGSPTLTTTPLVEVAGLTIRHGGQAVLEHVDLSVRSGEIVCLIGPNGAGKTTLLRAILGLIPADNGTIRRSPGLRIGYMPQRLVIDPTLPITMARFLSLSGRSDRAMQCRVLEEVGIAHLATRPMQALSGGETQRALLARALLNQPDLLILDEPAQGVDVSGQVELFELIGRIRTERGCGVLMVSHDLHLVMAATDRVVCLNQHICCTGHPEDVSRDPAYLSLFGPRAAQVLAVYQHHHDHHHTTGGDVVPLAEDSSVHHHDHCATHGHTHKPHHHG